MAVSVPLSRLTSPVRRGSVLDVSRHPRVMDATRPVSVEQAAPRKSWPYFVFIVIITVVTLFAGAFLFPVGEGSYYQPPHELFVVEGLMFVLSAMLCCLAFFRCPSHPRWSKILALVLCVPSLLFAVYVICLFVG